MPPNSIFSPSPRQDPHLNDINETRISNQELIIKRRLEREMALYGGKPREKRKKPNEAIEEAPGELHAQQDSLGGGTSAQGPALSQIDPMMPSKLRREQNVQYRLNSQRDRATQHILQQKYEQECAAQDLKERIVKSRAERMERQQRMVQESLERAAHLEALEENREANIQEREMRALSHFQQVIEESQQERQAILEKRKRMRLVFMDAPSHHLESKVQRRQQQRVANEQHKTLEEKRQQRLMEKENSRRQQFHSYVDDLREQKKNAKLQQELIEAAQKNAVAQKIESTNDRFRSRWRKQQQDEMLELKRAECHTTTPTHPFSDSSIHDDALRATTPPRFLMTPPSKSPNELAIKTDEDHPPNSSPSPNKLTLPISLPDDCSPRKAKILEWEYLSRKLSEIQKQLDGQSSPRTPESAAAAKRLQEENMLLERQIEALTAQVSQLLQTMDPDEQDWQIASER